MPDVSGVILLRPTVSPIVYRQQIRKLDAIGMVWESRNELAWARN